MDRPGDDEVGTFDGPGQSGDMVVIARFLDPSEAEMAKGMLDAAGVEAYLEGENANALFPGVFRAVLAVKTVDEAAARGLLQQADETGPEE